MQLKRHVSTKIASLSLSPTVNVPRVRLVSASSRSRPRTSVSLLSLRSSDCSWGLRRHQNWVSVVGGSGGRGHVTEPRDAPLRFGHIECDDAVALGTEADELRQAKEGRDVDDRVRVDDKLSQVAQAVELCGAEKKIVLSVQGTLNS